MSDKGLNDFKDEICKRLDSYEEKIKMHQRYNNRTLIGFGSIMAVFIVFVFTNTQDVNKMKPEVRDNTAWINHLRDNTISTNNVIFLLSSIEKNMDIIMNDNPSKEKIKKYSEDYRELRKNIFENNKARTRGKTID